MASALYDSGWVPVASGAINANVETRDFNCIRVLLAASGTNGATGSSMFWKSGADSPIGLTGKLNKTSVAYGCLPKLSGSITVANPAANTTNQYVINPYLTASLTSFVPTELNISLTAGSASYARIVVEGK